VIVFGPGFRDLPSPVHGDAVVDDGIGPSDRVASLKGRLNRVTKGPFMYTVNFLS
jgi:hypothetical protein